MTFKIKVDAHGDFQIGVLNQLMLSFQILNLINENELDELI